MSQIDAEKFAAGISLILKDALAPILGRVEAVEKALADIPEAAKIADLLASDELKTIVDLQVAESVAEFLTANPPAPGADGKAGEPGKDGRDGLDVKDLLRADGGRLIAVMSDGSTKDLGQFVGKDGEDGKDGLSFESASASFDSERGFVLTLTAGDRVKEFELPAYAHDGFYRDGMNVKACHSVTHDGSLWIAKRETCSRPCRENSEDWILAARKGSDAVPVQKRSQPRGPIPLAGYQPNKPGRDDPPGVD